MDGVAASIDDVINQAAAYYLPHVAHIKGQVDQATEVITEAMTVSQRLSSVDSLLESTVQLPGSLDRLKKAVYSTMAVGRAPVQDAATAHAAVSSSASVKFGAAHTQRRLQRRGTSADTTSSCELQQRAALADTTEALLYDLQNVQEALTSGLGASACAPGLPCDRAILLQQLEPIAAAAGAAADALASARRMIPGSEVVASAVHKVLLPAAEDAAKELAGVAGSAVDAVSSMLGDAVRDGIEGIVDGVVTIMKPIVGPMKKQLEHASKLIGSAQSSVGIAEQGCRNAVKFLDSMSSWLEPARQARRGVQSMVGVVDTVREVRDKLKSPAKVAQVLHDVVTKAKIGVVEAKLNAHTALVRKARQGIEDFTGMLMNLISAVAAPPAFPGSSALPSYCDSTHVCLRQQERHSKLYRFTFPGRFLMLWDHSVQPSSNSRFVGRFTLAGLYDDYQPGGVAFMPEP